MYIVWMQLGVYISVKILFESDCKLKIPNITMLGISTHFEYIRFIYEWHNYLLLRIQSISHSKISSSREF